MDFIYEPFSIQGNHLHHRICQWNPCNERRSISVKSWLLSMFHYCLTTQPRKKTDAYLLTKSFEWVNWQHRINFSNSMINHANIHFSHWRGAKAQNDSFRNSHDGQFTFSTQVIKLNYRGLPFTTPQPPSPAQHHSFSWNLLPSAIYINIPRTSPEALRSIPYHPKFLCTALRKS